LRQIEIGRGAGDVQAVGNGDEDTKLFERHVVIRSI
jgi:hypothetical protein